jgi:cystathionine beta-lyase
MEPCAIAAVNCRTEQAMAKNPPDLDRFRPQTRLIAAGRTYAEHGFINPAVYHASTVTFPSSEVYRSSSQDYLYGRRGTPTSRALEEAISIAEGGHFTRLTPSGLAAVSTALFAFLSSGDHILMSDAIYLPARNFATGTLARLGVDTTFFDPLIGAGIADLIGSRTRMIYVESPGSRTMEVLDVPAIAAAGRRAGVLVVIDNTWAAGRFFNAFAAGCDVSVVAATKYIVGHSDAMLGSITVTEALADRFRRAHEELGQCAGPDDIYLGLRGLRSLDARLERHQRNGLVVAEWLLSRPEVAEVLYPALPGAAGHELWKRDFTGASSLFSLLLKPCSEAAVAAFVDGLELFGLGASWGGFESLILPFHPPAHRVAAHRWTPQMPGIRLHIGLENPHDLMADLAAGFERMKGL